MKYGLISFAGFVAYYLLMKLTGLNQIVELRMLNFVIQIAAIWMAVRSFRRSQPEAFSYLGGMATGMKTAAWGVTPFAVFFFFYLELINPDFLEVVNIRETFGLHFSAAFAAFVIFIEGIAAGFLATYVTMQYFKAAIVRTNEADTPDSPEVPSSEKSPLTRLKA